MLLAMPAVYGEQIAEKQIITEYIISVDEFKKLKNLEDLKKYKGSESKPLPRMILLEEKI